MSVCEIKSENAMLQRRSLLHTLFFLLGFSIIFIALALVLAGTNPGSSMLYLFAYKWLRNPVFQSLLLYRQIEMDQKAQ